MTLSSCSIYLEQKLTKGSNGETALHKAIIGGHDSTAQYLIREAKADVNIANNEQDTAEHLSAARGQLDIVKLIHVDSVDVNKQGYNGETALHKAIKGHASTVEYLIREAKADINIVDYDNDTMLHLAASRGFLNIVKLLHISGAEIDIRGFNGETALHKAIFGRPVSTAQYLIRQARADVNITDNGNYTALHYAAWKGVAKVLQTQLTYFADQKQKSMLKTIGVVLLYTTPVCLAMSPLSKCCCRQEQMPTSKMKMEKLPEKLQENGLTMIKQRKKQ